MSEDTNQFIEGPLEIPPGIVRITVGWDSMHSASEICFMGFEASGKAWLLGYRKVPTSSSHEEGERLTKAAVSAEREACATLVAPLGPRPCDCTSCYCQNTDDLRDVTDWDTATALAASIRGRS